ncbi:hypothetical protein RR46_07028 [Papilio xuthus]|uniref:Uncharacterized protein n=1 Tax=Papilio xuthus TaxID=66420 RepID=A0A194Q4H3_PAPXU|nr:hypothetical protein RR46_07028 [Papilio xuthus]
MESKNRSGAVKSKRSKRRFLTKSDNYMNSNETNKNVDKYTLKTRGPYVVRNPPKLNTDDNLDDGPTPKNRTEKKENQRKFSSTVITTSLLGNRKFITHEVVKTKRKNRNNKTEQNDISTNDVNNSKDLKVKAKSKSSYKKSNKDDDIIYVLPSRNYNYESITNTISMISKQDNPSNLCNKEIHQTCSGFDRIADEVLEGWIKRKEKIKSSEQAIISKEKPNEVFNLCVDFIDPNNDENIQEIPSTSKTERTFIKSQKSISRNTLQNNYDIDLTDNNISNKFYIIEDESKPRLKKPKTLVKNNLKTQSFIHSKQTRTNKKHNYKDIKRNSKKEFISLIKKELQLPIYEEPRNMFEALKTLARQRNKDNHISFVDGIASKTRNAECDYDNPKLIKSFKKFIPKSKIISYPRTQRKANQSKIPSPLEVKHFHKTTVNKLQVITI